jgi:putative protease
MIHENLLSVLDDFLAFLSRIHVDGIVCFDLSVLAMAEKNGLADLIIYRPGTMNTNSYDPWFFRKLKIKGLTLSKDITLEELISIGEDYQGMEISLVGHGYLFLFYSKRPLLKDYFEYKHAKTDFLNDESFRLAEQARHGEYYPIYEDKFGTHIFRSKKLQSFNEIKVMRPYLSDLFIERMFLADTEYFEAIAAYCDERLEASFLTRYGHGYDSGFYYTKTAPKKGAEL